LFHESETNFTKVDALSVLRGWLDGISSNPGKSDYRTKGSGPISLGR
jgi:hypothetical protein